VYLGVGFQLRIAGEFTVHFRFILLAALVAFGVSASAQNQAAQADAPDRAEGLRTAFARVQHLKRGINASGWFAQHAGDYSAAWTDKYTDSQDIALIAKMGFDNVRLSVDATPLEGWPRGADGLNSEFLARLDKAVDTMLADGLAVTIDVHPESAYKLRVKTTDDGVDRFVMLWRRLAAHYAGRDPERVFFEIMNEPEVNDPYRWAGIQARVAAAIREVAPRQTIIATGGNWSDIVDLLKLHPLEDGNVIYNFHFYDPHQFTHQGAGWGAAWWVYEHGIPYPATESSMAELVKEVPDLPNRYEMENYWLDHWDGHRIRLLIDEGAAWGKMNGVPLICNEFGVFRDHSEPASRNAWIKDVRTALEADGIGWAMWDYRGNFGVVVKADGQAAQPDAGTAAALGLGN
jgi:aryl-phospho-beta-D-glucosidase BglC (GH1 family)